MQVAAEACRCTTAACVETMLSSRLPATSTLSSAERAIDRAGRRMLPDRGVSGPDDPHLTQLDRQPGPLPSWARN
jgi:hypothetical protein